MENRSILCCISVFKPSEAVIDYSSWLARQSQTTLKIFHAIDTQYTESEADLSGSIGLGAREELLKEFVEMEHQQNKLLQKKGKLILDAAQERAGQNGVNSIDLCLRKGKVLENLLDLKEITSIAVLGKSDTSSVGHKVESTVRALENPILIVTEKYSEPKSLCLAFDGSDGARKALSFVAKNSCFHNLEIHLTYVGEETEKIKEELNEAIKTLGSCSLNSKIVILKGEISLGLKEYIMQNNISLLSMGAFSHSWLRDMVMGSLTSKIISTINVPILLVR